MIADLQIALPPTWIADFCRRWNVDELAIFGSALRSDFKAGSDLDVLVRFRPGLFASVFDLVAMRRELEQQCGRRVDLIDRRVVEESDNHFRRDAILNSAQVVYAA